jgi:hypothetical protein
MIKTVIIEDMNHLYELLNEQEYREDLKRNRNLFVYRGQPDADFKLTTSLARNCKDKKKELEPCMLRNFTKYAVLEEPSIENSVWRQMIFGQHHGLPTRLLDWSFSPLIALHFSVTESDLDEMELRDSAVWRTDIHELHDLLPEKYQKIAQKYNTTVFSVDMILEACQSLDMYDQDMGNHAMLMVEPPSVDVRIVNQYSFFSVIPNDMDDIEGFLDAHTEKTVRYIIRKDLRWQIRDMLDHQNISERIVYPGLDGLSRWLGRHYYVK